MPADAARAQLLITGNECTDGATAAATIAPRAVIIPEKSVSVTSGNRLSRAII
jgi:hypothetical protein